MTYRIIRERAKVTTACAGMEGYDAEVTVEVWDDNKHMNGVYYVHANCFEGFHYTVAKKSMFEFMTNLSDEDPGEIEFIEEYEKISQTKDSEFSVAFKAANRMLKDMGC